MLSINLHTCARAADGVAALDGSSAFNATDDQEHQVLVISPMSSLQLIFHESMTLASAYEQARDAELPAEASSSQSRASEASSCRSCVYHLSVPQEQEHALIMEVRFTLDVNVLLLAA